MTTGIRGTKTASERKIWYYSHLSDTLHLQQGKLWNNSQVNIFAQCFPPLPAPIISAVAVVYKHGLSPKAINFIGLKLHTSGQKQ